MKVTNDPVPNARNKKRKCTVTLDISRDTPLSELRQMITQSFATITSTFQISDNRRDLKPITFSTTDELLTLCRKKVHLRKGNVVVFNHSEIEFVSIFAILQSHCISGARNALSDIYSSTQIRYLSTLKVIIKRSSKLA